VRSSLSHLPSPRKKGADVARRVESQTSQIGSWRRSPRADRSDRGASRNPVLTATKSARPAATAAVVAATLGLAAASWVVAVRRMNGMDMGVATALGSFPVFVILWMWIMAAMMLPGAVPNQQTFDTS
jgi:hypothetical protein